MALDALVALDAFVALDADTRRCSDGSTTLVTRCSCGDLLFDTDALLTPMSDLLSLLAAKNDAVADADFPTKNRTFCLDAFFSPPKLRNFDLGTLIFDQATLISATLFSTKVGIFASCSHATSMPVADAP